MPLFLPHTTNKVIANLRWNQTFTIFKTTRTPDEFGRAVVAEITTTANGVIQPTSGEDIDRLLDGDRSKQAITVWTKEPLSTGTGQELPDEIEWRGTRYMVRHVRDWKDYGIGFCRAVCVAQNMKGRAEQ